MSEKLSTLGIEGNVEMDRPNIAARKITNGFEFGHGKISGLAAEHEVLALVEDTIRKTEILVPIDLDDDGQPINDDGCGDGRGVLTTFSAETKYNRSLNRSKVFGGSATMAAACIIGLGEAKDAPLNDVFDEAIRTLDFKDMDFGAHTDEHMHGNNCGCGAIDKAPEILLASLKYEIPIRGVVTYFMKDLESLDEVYSNLRNYVPQMVQQPEYSGMKVMDTILNNKSTRIVKQLGGDHKECRIVLNTVRGHTINQQLVRDVTNNKAQIFGVDVWRMQDIVANLYPDQPELQQKAFLSELIYTVATAAVLTKGDLPVDVIEAAA